MSFLTKFFRSFLKFRPWPRPRGVDSLAGKPGAARGRERKVYESCEACG